MGETEAAIITGIVLKTPGVTLVEGHARLTGPKEVAIGARRLTAERIFLNVGARAAVPDLPGVRTCRS
jgi:pyruvate/2-oxoglutarate dehydrogenase complex dihydrolipoamide dehydrogenase (E3) component